MNINEIYVVNRALDGEDIFSLPPLSELEISDFLVDAIKDGLVKKGILEDYETFTDEGVVLARRLKLFKEAPKQVKLNNVTSLGVVNENESVLIMYNPWLDDYKIQMVDTTDATAQLVESYDFLSNVNIDDSDNGEGQPLSSDNFDATYSLDSENSLRVLTKTSDISTDEVYFSVDNGLFVYDYNENVLYKKTREDVIGQLRERMSAPCQR